MNCSRCGAYYSQGQRFCTGCGRDFTMHPSTSETPPGAPADFRDWAAPPREPDEILGRDGLPVGARPSGGAKSRLSSTGAGAVGLLALLAKAKGLLLLLKFGKFGLTFVTMVVSVAAYAAFFGLSFAIGFVLLLLVHEMGHWVVLRAKGVPANAPVFIPFLGALIGMRGMPRSVKDAAEIGIGGPIAGTAAALLVGITGALLPAGHTQSLLYALGYTGLLLNLFNLIPVSPLDGGRIMGAISRWAWPIGLAILLLLFFNHPNGILALILLLGGFETINRFLRRDRAAANPGYYTIATQERLILAIVFFGLLGVAFGGMELLHEQLLAINSGAV